MEADGGRGIRSSARDRGDRAPIQASLESGAFGQLRDLILQAGGIDLELYKERCILRRITVRQRACGASNLRAYLKLVRQNPEERARLLSVLTIHVSQFFRNPGTFRSIREEVLPAILAKKQAGGGRALRFWSVGCAGGEEPYSLAILLRETGAEALRDYSTAIYATDVDPASLQQAREGRYPLSSLADVPARWRRQYFIQDGDRCQIVPEIRRLVSFKQHNVVDRLPFGRIDLLLCRNVLIYMTEALQRRVLESVYEALNPGGFLVLGKVEGLCGTTEGLLEPVNVAERVYRRPASRLGRPE